MQQALPALAGYQKLIHCDIWPLHAEFITDLSMMGLALLHTFSPGRYMNPTATARQYHQTLFN